MPTIAIRASPFQAQIVAVRRNAAIGVYPPQTVSAEGHEPAKTAIQLEIKPVRQRPGGRLHLINDISCWRNRENKPARIVRIGKWRVDVTRSKLVNSLVPKIGDGADQSFRQLLLDRNADVKRIGRLQIRIEFTNGLAA